MQKHIMGLGSRHCLYIKVFSIRCNVQYIKIITDYYRQTSLEIHTICDKLEKETRITGKNPINKFFLKSTNSNTTPTQKKNKTKKKTKQTKTKNPKKEQKRGRKNSANLQQIR